MRFLDYAAASLGEAEQRLQDGIQLSYFKAEDCTEAFKLARRCLTASIRLKQSQQRYLKDNPRNPKRKTATKPDADSEKKADG